MPSLEQHREHCYHSDRGCLPFYFASTVAVNGAEPSAAVAVFGEAAYLYASTAAAYNRWCPAVVIAASFELPVLMTGMKLQILVPELAALLVGAYKQAVAEFVGVLHTS